MESRPIEGVEPPKDITWQELKDFVNSLDEETLKERIPVLIGDATSAVYLNEPFKMEYDVYSNIHDVEDSGPLEELKELWGDEYDESLYKLVTKKGTAFLWID